MDNRNVVSVNWVNTHINSLMQDDPYLNNILVRGEVSNCKYHGSGHLYFSLKEDASVISCVMFAFNCQKHDFRIKNGDKIIVFGSVKNYVRDGKYQIYVTAINREGVGDLHEKFEKLKKELEEKGLFANEYKKQIPKYINTLGVATANTGAAVQDIIQIAKRRNPFIQIVVCPTIVQGELAINSIVNSIKMLELYGVDTIIVGRGGGSIEDLWAFNEEAVAQAIFDCSTPIISAVGHETDTTIADWVADLRAPTPSAAAELAVYEINELYERFNDYKLIYNRNVCRIIEKNKRRLELYKTRIENKNPTNLIRNRRMDVIRYEEKLQQEIKKKLRLYRYNVSILAEKLKGLSPLEKLTKGYAYISDDKDMTIRSVGRLKVGDKISVQLVDGSIGATIDELSKQEA